MKKKIVMIGLKGLPAHGGAATVGENIINELKHEFDFTVLSVSSHTQLSSGSYSGYQQLVFKKVGRGSMNTLIYYLKSLVHCMTHRYDLVHLHHAESGFIVPFLKLKYKVVVTFHGIFLMNDSKFSSFHNRFFRFSERLNVKRADEVVSVSKPDCNYVAENYGRQLRYIPNSIKVHQPAPSDEKNPYLVFAAGRIYHIKGLHLLLQAVREKKLNRRILVVGDLDQVQEYKEEILRMSEGLDVSFKGLVRDKATLIGLLADAELFVFPSLTEAMSIMLLEAVSARVPVIASDIPSNLGIFNDEEMTFFKSGDAVDLGNKIEYALTNGEKGRAKAHKAFTRLTQEYTCEIVGNKYRNIYIHLMN